MQREEEYSIQFFLLLLTSTNRHHRHPIMHRNWIKSGWQINMTLSLFLSHSFAMLTSSSLLIPLRQLNSAVTGVRSPSKFCDNMQYDAAERAAWDFYWKIYTHTHMIALTANVQIEISSSRIAKIFMFTLSRSSEMYSLRIGIKTLNACNYMLKVLRKSLNVNVIASWCF